MSPLQFVIRHSCAMLITALAVTSSAAAGDLALSAGSHNLPEFGDAGWHWSGSNRFAVGDPGDVTRWRRSLWSLPQPATPLNVFAMGPGSSPVPGNDPPEATLVGWIPNLLLAGGLAALQLAVDPPDDSRWTDRNGFDSSIRRGFRGESRSTRKAAETASDVLLGSMGIALVTDWWWLRDEYGLWRSTQVDTRWLLANNVTTRAAKVSVGRQRPYVQPCGRNDNYIPSCTNGRDRNGGFFSGHASNAATMAGLLCARHLHRREVGAVDWAVCGGATAGALATGMLRMVSEHHFATDVLVGWTVGAIFGYVVPAHFDYRHDSAVATALERITPMVGSDAYGLRYAFEF